MLTDAPLLETIEQTCDEDYEHVTHEHAVPSHWHHDTDIGLEDSGDYALIEVSRGVGWRLVRVGDLCACHQDVDENGFCTNNLASSPTMATSRSKKKEKKEKKHIAPDLFATLPVFVADSIPETVKLNRKPKIIHRSIADDNSLELVQTSDDNNELDQLVNVYNDDLNVDEG